MPRYTTTGIPQQLATGSALGLSAFMPHFNRLAASGAQAYKGGVEGYPGTKQIPLTARRDSVPSPDLGDIAQMGLSRSTDNYDAFWPNLYYVHADPVWDLTGGTSQIQVYDPVRPQDTTMIPVPAVDLRGLYGNRSARLSGGIDNNRRSALKQAFNFVRWPNRRSGNGPGTGSP